MQTEETQIENQEVFHTEPTYPVAERETRIELVRKVLVNMKDSIENALHLLEAGTLEEVDATVKRISGEKHAIDADIAEATGIRVVEGVFDGQNMVGSDGKVYTVPPNYASKSRLVEGDILKLTIRKDGSFIFKQIGPIDRKRVIATLGHDDETQEYLASDEDGNNWKVLTASVTYYRGIPGDEIVVLVPRQAPSVWAAVENVVKK